MEETKKVPIIFRKKCTKCGKYIPSASLARKCPYCGCSLVALPIVKKKNVGGSEKDEKTELHLKPPALKDGVTPHVILMERELEKRKRQGDLVKDFKFPDVNEEIRKAKEKK